MDEREILERAYSGVLAAYRAGDNAPEIPGGLGSDCDVIIAHQEQARGALAVLTTLLAKKIASPEQDIRLHQAGMSGGFSGRGLDSRVVTPFLRDHSFPYMASGSGWLTRSLEQPAPYTLDYPGNIRPAAVKWAFLSIIDGVQTGGASAESVLRGLLWGLVEFRERNSSIALARPVNLSVSETVDKIRRHYAMPLQGAARLPVLAVHAMLSIATREMERYAEYSLSPLEHHTAADTRTDTVGDAQIVNSDGVPFEGYEIKHNIPITSDLIAASFEKFRTTPIDRFYILTTYDHADYSEFAPDIRRVADVHGCQLIVNGVDRTLMYYLRLIKRPPDFVHRYVSNLEIDQSIGFQLKTAWNQIAES